jgi:hypothetical protein
MKLKLICLFLILKITAINAQTSIPSAEVQIKSAVLAAPEDKRDGAMVYGFNEKKELIVLRKGTNEMVCIADDPDVKGLNVSAYHKDLDAFMARGRALKKEGKGYQEIFDTREKEVKAGKLNMPKQPSTLFVYSASEENFDTKTGEVKDGKLRYVIYIPYATAEGTGLPLGPEAPGMPWIMNPGTHASHIMINP